MLNFENHWATTLAAIEKNELLEVGGNKTGCGENSEEAIMIIQFRDDVGTEESTPENQIILY